MEANDKDRLREKLARGIGKEVSYDEKRRRKEAAKCKAQDRARDRPRVKRWGEEDEHDEPARRSLRTTGEASRERGTESALVVGVERTLVRVRRSDGSLATAMRIPSAPWEPVVGDLARLEDSGELRLVALEPRRSVLARPDPSRAGHELVLAANIDLVGVVLSVARPALRPALVERVAIAVGRGGARLLVIVNKIDALDDESNVELELAREDWRAAEIGFIEVSATRGDGLDDLRRAVEGRRLVLVGHSGVGKSSLVNALATHARRAVGEVREFDGKGRHTSSSSALIELWPGTELVDTPGVRQFGLGRVSVLEAHSRMADIATRAEGCRFRDCSHANEPDCAVRRAVERGELARRRLGLFERLVRGDDG